MKERVCEMRTPGLMGKKWSAALVSFTNQCLVKDVNRRWSVGQLMNVSVLSKSNA